MSVIQSTINGVPSQVITSYMQSLSILSAGLDENANTTLNNVVVQNYPDGGNIKIGELAMISSVNNPLTNIAIGYNALPVVNGITSNSDNIAIGQNSLSTITTGGKNIGIGLNTLSGLTTETNTIGIGNNTIASSSNGIIIGNNAKLTANNSGILKFDSITTNTTYPASNEFWFGDSSTGWIDVKAGDVFVDNLDVSGALTTGSLSLDSLQVTSDTGELDIKVRNSNYNTTLNKIDEIRNTASFRNKFGPIAFIADVSGVISSDTDPILREKILFGYQQGTKAIEINSNGAISLDSVNSGNPVPALISNYGTNGQVIMSQGSSLNARWSNISDISGVIGLNNRNISGITYVRDSSGNLDSSSNFIFDGSGIKLTGTKSGTYPIIQLVNNGTGTTARTQFTLANPTTTGTLELKSSTYQRNLNLIDESGNTFTINNSSGDIALIPGSSKKVLLGYQAGAKAVEINSLGAMSFDTSGNNDSPLTFTSNYGISGEQIMISRGSNAPPRWGSITDVSGGITVFNKNIGGIPFVVDTSGNLDSSSNFIFDDDYGIYVTKNINQYKIVGHFTNLNNGDQATAVLEIGVGSDESTYGFLQRNSSIYQPIITNSLVTLPDAFTIQNVSGSVILAGSGFGSVLLGYQAGAKAVEINSLGAMSFDTSGNNDSPLTFTSNYGTSGQILSSQGSTLPPQWIDNTGGGGGIIVQNPIINGIPFVVDTSGNLDSSSNFIYDGSGIYIKSQKFGDYYGMTIENTATAAGASTTQLKFVGFGNSGLIDLKGSSFQQYNNRIDQTINNFSFKSPNGDISLMPGYASLDGGKIIMGYNLGYKAIEINRYGAMSFDTSGNNDTPLTFTSNYGTSGQMLTSQGSNAPPQWTTPYTGFPKIIFVTSAQYTFSLIDSSGGLFSYNVSSGLNSGRTRVITFTTTFRIDTPGTATYITFSLYINAVFQKSFNINKPTTTDSRQYTFVFTYSNTNTFEFVSIVFQASDASTLLQIDSTELYNFRMEEIQ